MSEVKICRACSVEKNASAFTKSKQNRDGLHSYCMKCKHDQRKKLIAADPEKYRARQAVADKRYALQNPEKLRAVRIAWGLRNIERVRARGKAWVEKNREKVRMYIRMSNARRRSNGGRNNSSMVERLKILQRRLCAICRTDISQHFHVDHILPIKLGGGNEATNLQLLCPTCNCSKRAMHPIEFMQRRGFLL